MEKSATVQTRTKNQASTLKQERYQEIIGFIMFLMVETRPNIAFVTLIVGQFAKNPGFQYIEVIKTIFRYLKGFRDQRITYEDLG